MPEQSPYAQDSVCGNDPIPGAKKQITLDACPLLQLDFTAPLDHLAALLEVFEREPFAFPEGSDTGVVSIGTFNQRKNVPLVGTNVSLGHNTYVSTYVRRKGSADTHAETFYIDYYNASAAYRFVNTRFNAVATKAAGSVTYEETDQRVRSWATAPEPGGLITRLEMGRAGLPEHPFRLQFTCTTCMPKVGATEPSDLWRGAYAVDSEAWSKPFSPDDDAIEIAPEHFGKQLSPSGVLEDCGLVPLRWLWIPKTNVTYFKLRS